jgi:hypothetical protein
MKTCTLCNNPHHARGLCAVHYAQKRRDGEFTDSLNVKRGGTHSHPLYIVFTQMIARVQNPNRWNYKYYGGRGVTVCERWLSPDGFQNFIEDMGDRPNGYQLDRINVDGNYEPSNCRWVSKYQQMANTSKSNQDAGVSWHKQRNKWRARIKINRKDISLGLYNDYKDAVKARNDAMILYGLQ